MGPSTRRAAQAAALVCATGCGGTTTQTSRVDDDAPCTTVATRPAGEHVGFSMHSPDGTRLQTVNLRLGERICVQPTETAEGLGPLEIVPRADPKRPAIKLALSTASDGISLSVTNGFSKTLVYSAVVKLHDGEGRFPTAVCPVGPRQVGTELWSEPVEEVAVYELALGSRSAGSCR